MSVICSCNYKKYNTEKKNYSFIENENFTDKNNINSKNNILKYIKNLFHFGNLSFLMGISGNIDQISLFIYYLFCSNIIFNNLINILSIAASPPKGNIEIKNKENPILINHIPGNENNRSLKSNNNLEETKVINVTTKFFEKNLNKNYYSNWKKNDTKIILILKIL